MAISVYEAQESFSTEDLGNWLRGASRNARLRDRIRSLLRSATGSKPFDTPDVQYFADKYGEQITYDVVQDIAKFIRFRDLVLVTPGGIPIPYPPLEIQGRHIKPSNTAIGMIGEALAGWHLEQKGLTCVSRPISEGVDLIFRDEPGTIICLVSAKGTQEPDVVGILGDAGVKLLQETLNVVNMDKSSTFDCFVIGVVIRSQSEYDLHSLRIEVRQ